MVNHHPNDSHPPFKMYEKEVYYRLTKLKWVEVQMVSPISKMVMVTHHPKDGHPQPQIYQKEVYYRLLIFRWSEIIPDSPR